MNNLMTAHSIRSHEQPLSNNELQRYAPSVFATEPWHQMSSRYAFIPTIQVVDKMRSEGFFPVQATQSRTRIAGKGDFTKHAIRFRDMRQGNTPVVRDLGTLYPELLLTNAHDGASAYKLDAGLFRLVCLNGMVVGDKMVPSINVRHTGDASDVIDATFEVVEQFPKVLESVEKFNQLRLEPGEQKAFATAALALRYDEGEAPITPERMVSPRRSEDQSPTLWNTFNTVQERLTQGGDRYRTEAQPRTETTPYRPSRRMRTRAVEGISENTRLNKALWTLASELQKLRG